MLAEGVQKEVLNYISTIHNSTGTGKLLSARKYRSDCKAAKHVTGINTSISWMSLTELLTIMGNRRDMVRRILDKRTRQRHDKTYGMIHRLQPACLIEVSPLTPFPVKISRCSKKICRTKNNGI
jgi:hypothetical protein